MESITPRGIGTLRTSETHSMKESPDTTSSIKDERRKFVSKLQTD